MVPLELAPFEAVPPLPPANPPVDVPPAPPSEPFGALTPAWPPFALINCVVLRETNDD